MENVSSVLEDVTEDIGKNIDSISKNVSEQMDNNKEQLKKLFNMNSNSDKNEDDSSKKEDDSEDENVKDDSKKSEDDEDDNEFTGVELGFVDEFEGDERKVWKIWSTGKIGGRPEWLETRSLPRPEDLICDHCKEPMHFLAQMYAPVDELPRAFHRVLYVFCCRRNVCLRKENGGKGAIRVLRSQLPEKNELYAPDFKHSKKEEELELMDDDELDALEEKEWDSG